MKTEQIIAEQLRSVAPNPCDRVLLIANAGNGNTGDEALLAATLRLLPDRSRACVLTRSPRVVESMHDVDANAMTVRGFLDGIRSSKAVVVVGGGMFGQGIPLLVRILPLVLLLLPLLGRRFCYLATGCYPGTPTSTLWALRRAAEGAHRFSVRDALSARTLAREVSIVDDLAFALPAAKPQQANAMLAFAGLTPGRPLLILAPKYLPDQQVLEQFLLDCRDAVHRWRTRGGDVIAIALSSHADYGMGRHHRDTELARRIGVPVLGPNLAPELAKAIVFAADAVIGLRLHALIFAISGEVPALTLPTEQKTTALLDAHPHVASLTTRSMSEWVENTFPALHPNTVAREKSILGKR